ncbi:MAG TPA: 50S ribosomal protein L18 [Melioribacteraceae bacterium]|nr:50S ribosomal protein L18 [Melioribacteraceae bacterium]
MIKTDNNRRARKQERVRKKIKGTPEKPRLSVFRSLSKIYLQVIDDVNGVTLASASSLSTEIAEELKNTKTKLAQSKLVGKLLGKVALEKGIETVVFDRNGYGYHGRIKSAADGARESGLKF